jgi:hypothetical protein
MASAMCSHMICRDASMASLTTYTIDVVDGYWAGCLGCPHEMLRPSHTFVIPHADELLDYAGIFILRLGNAPIVSLPHGLYPWLGPTAERWSAFDVLNATHLHSVFGTRIDKIIGPAFIGYTDHAMFHAGGGPSACLLGEKDQACVSARSFAVYHQARGRQLFISLLSRVEGLGAV